MKPRQEFPVTITESGVVAKIYRGSQTHNGTRYQGFIVAYSLLGKRKQVWRTEYSEAEATAKDACRKIANGEQVALTLTNTDRLVHLRAAEAVKPTGIAIDVACQVFAEAMGILGGRASIAEACREYVRRHSMELPRITVENATTELEIQMRADRKSRRRQQQVSSVLDRLANDIQAEVHTMSPDIISRWLSGLPFSERTRRNYRDVIGYFNRYLIRRGYLAKGTDWLDGVQNYSARKLSEIEIYTPDEVTKLLTKCDKRMLPFVAIQAFAGLRHAEVARLDWSEIDLADGFIEVRANKSKTGERRLVPIHENLKQWLAPHRKDAGRVCPFANTTKQLLWTADDAGVEWKHNGLRHSFVSYRTAETADVARVADEAGNSPQVIRQHYLRRVKPAQAAEWFGIVPG